MRLFVGLVIFTGLFAMASVVLVGYVDRDWLGYRGPKTKDVTSVDHGRFTVVLCCCACWCSYVAIALTGLMR